MRLPCPIYVHSLVIVVSLAGQLIFLNSFHIEPQMRPDGIIIIFLLFFIKNVAFFLSFLRYLLQRLIVGEVEISDGFQVFC